MKLVSYEITIDAPAPTVYRHLTEAAGLLRWMAVDAVADPTPGGELRWTHENGATMVGRFVELIPHRRIVFRYGWRDDLMGIPPESTTVEIALREDDGRTTLTLEHRDLPADHAQAHADGWEHFLANLTEVLTG